MAISGGSFGAILSGVLVGTVSLVSGNMGTTAFSGMTILGGICFVVVVAGAEEVLFAAVLVVVLALMDFSVMLPSCSPAVVVALSGVTAPVCRSGVISVGIFF